jgi:phosphoribosylanthranilate isomerase
MVRTRVKICGITDGAQARAVSEAGADAMGLVFYPDSPRYVTPERAAEICRDVGPLVTVVGLFVDPNPEWVATVLSTCTLDQLQFHGEEDAGFCEQFARPYIKALRMRPGLDIAAAVAAHPQARAFLLDAYRPGVPGGTGDTFPWERIPPIARPWMLAGGLTPENVSTAIGVANPPAVDVSGGVERAPGEKDPTLIRQFINVVRCADQGMHEETA